MHQDDEPLDAATTTPSGSDAVAAQGVPSGTSLRPAIDEHLFEDILDLEGSLRLSTQSTAGLGAPRAGEIESLGRKLADAVSMKMQAMAHDIRNATQAGDTGKVRACHLEVIDTLVALRTSLWSVKSDD